MTATDVIDFVTKDQPFTKISMGFTTEPPDSKQSPSTDLVDLWPEESVEVAV